MIAPRPDNFPIELLAAYVDGELTAPDRARVERWLAENPDALDTLEGQEALSPGNAEFWEAVRPPTPSAARWRTVSVGVSASTVKSRRLAKAGWIGSLGLALTAASLMFVLPGQGPNSPDQHLKHRVDVAVPDPADSQPYPMASTNDVTIISLPESATNLLVVGEHPLGDSMLSFALGNEVQFLGIGSDLAGRFPEVMSEATEETLPMLWAPRAPD